MFWVMIRITAHSHLVDSLARRKFQKASNFSISILDHASI